MALADRIWRPGAPIHVEDGLEVTSRSAWAFCQVPLVTHPVIARGAVLSEVQKHIHLFNRAQGGTWHLSVLPLPLGPHVEPVALSSVTEDPAWAGFQKATRDYLAQAAHRGRVVLLGRLLGSRSESSWRRLTRLAERVAGAESSIEKAELEKWQRLRDRWVGECRAQVPRMEAASAGTIRWAIWRSYWRGLEGDQVNPPTDNATVGGSEALTLVNGVVRRRFDRVLLGDRGETQCSFFWLSHFPQGKTFEDGFDWAFATETEEFPTEVQVRFEVLPTSSAQREVGKAERDAKAQQAHVLEAHQEPPEELDETITVSRWERNRLNKTQGVQIKMHPRVATWARTTKELEEQRHRLQSVYEGLDIRADLARGSQTRLWAEAVPGDRVRVPYHEQRVPPETLCGSMYMGDNSLGDYPFGTYLGVSLGTLTGSVAHNPRGKMPIFEDVFLAANASLHVSRKGAFLLTGETGGGKTNDALKLTIEAAMRGATVVFVDPKRDADGLELLELRGFQRILLDESHAGLLNPLGLRKMDRLRQGILAAEVLQRMVNPWLLERGGYLIENAAMQEVKEEHPSMDGILRTIGLSDAPVAHEIVQNLEQVRSMPQGRLVFADPPPGTGLDIEGRLTLVQFQGIKVPDSSVSKPDLSERLTLGLMTALTGLLGEMIEWGIDWVPKLLVIDEAHLLLHSAQLERMIDTFERMGRSKFAVVGLSTQGMTEVVHRGLMNHIGVIRAYLTGHEAEFQAAAQLFPGLSYELAKQWLGAGQPRQFLMRDRYGRVGRGLRDLVFPSLVRILDTSPEGKRRLHEAVAEA